MKQFMNCIGIRVSPTEIYYCVTTKSNNEIELLTWDSLIIPKATDIPKQLAYVRTNFISIFNEFNISFAGIRVHEGNTRNLSIERIYLEGVCQELLANCSVQDYFLATLPKMSRIQKEDVSVLKGFINGENQLILIEGLAKSAKEMRESILTSVSTSELFIKEVTE